MALVALVVAGCAGVGGPKPGAPAHHRERGFANTNPDYARPPFWTRVGFFASRMWSATFSPRSVTLPRVATDARRLRENTTEATVTWVGHATLLVQLDGVNVLTDPQFSDRASPVSFAGPKRFNAPGLRVEDLPPIHVVVISHDHYDHLDRRTVQRLAATHRPRFLVPLGLKAWFASVGIPDAQELDWWDSRVERGLTITCVPVQHWTSRSFFQLNNRLWGGWVIAGRQRLEDADEQPLRPGHLALVAAPLGEPVGEDAAAQQGDDAEDAGGRAQNRTDLLQIHAVDTDEEGIGEGALAGDHQGDQSQGGAQVQEGALLADEAQHLAEARRLFRRLGRRRLPRHVAAEEEDEAEDRPWRGRGHHGPAPAVAPGDQPAADAGQRRADGAG